MNSIIIPTYCPVPEVADLLQQCVEKIAKHTVLPYELIVIEQGKRYFKQSPAQVTVYSSFDEPIGYAKAVNIGVGMAQGEYLFIVNNDIFVPHGWDHALIRDYELTHGCAMMSACDRPEVTSIQHDVSWWSCVCINRQRWKEIGPLNDELLNYRFHDQDWSIRATKAGYRVCRDGYVQVQHFEASTYRHMQPTVNEGGERAEMIRRYGVAHFYEWLLRRR
jgi:GT2 family glycosyltransferase